jgi:DNA polymerase-3 subunit epsilon
MVKNRFVALDLECATSDIGNICEIGLVVMENGVEVDRYRSLIRPVIEAFGDWQRWNFSYNLRDTLSSPTFPEIWAKVQPLIQDSPLVAHNASMVECKHLSAAFVHHNLLEEEKPVMFCTLDLARKGWPDLEKHGIKSVAKHFDWQLDHHNPESDARVCASIVTQVMQDNAFDTWDALVGGMNWQKHSLRTQGFHPLKSTDQKQIRRKKKHEDYAKELVSWNRTAEIQELCLGQRFILSGFSPRRKKELQSIAISKGLLYKRYISPGLNLLVADVKMGAAKYERCKIQSVPIWSEEEFLRALDNLPEQEG